MGTLEPPEHWAPPENLDPTPTWKQYLLIAILVLGLLVFAVLYVLAAVAPETATPPALIPGGRMVLSAGEHPPGTTKRVELAGPERAFFLTYAGREPVAIRALWTTEMGGGQMCEVRLLGEPIVRDGRPERVFVRADLEAVFVDTCTLSAFNSRGEVVAGEATRGLDQYLVSRKGDRLIVNLDRPIPGPSR